MPFFAQLVAGIIGFVVATSAPETAEVDRFPNTVFAVFHAANDTSFVAITSGVCATAKDFRTWKLYPMSPSEGVSDVVGGSPDHVLVIEQVGNSHRLQLLTPTGPAVTLCEEVGSRVSFASDQVGCMEAKQGLRLTIDGGRHWSATTAYCQPDEEVQSICWLSEHELLIGGTLGTVCDIPVEGVLKPARWKSNLSSGISQLKIFGKDKVLALGSRLEVVSRATGEVLQTITPDLNFEGVSADSSKIYFYGDGGVSVWPFHETKFKAEGIVQGPHVMGLLVDEQSVVAIGVDGDIFELAKNALTPIHIKIDRLSPKDAVKAAQPEVATPDEFREAFLSAGQVDLDTRNRVWGEAAREKGTFPPTAASLGDERVQASCRYHTPIMAMRPGAVGAACWTIFNFL